MALKEVYKIGLKENKTNSMTKTKYICAFLLATALI